MLIREKIYVLDEGNHLKDFMYFIRKIHRIKRAFIDCNMECLYINIDADSSEYSFFKNKIRNIAKGFNIKLVYGVWLKEPKKIYNKKLVKNYFTSSKPDLHLVWYVSFDLKPSKFKRWAFLRWYIAILGVWKVRPIWHILFEQFLVDIIEKWEYTILVY